MILYKNQGQGQLGRQRPSFTGFRGFLFISVETYCPIFRNTQIQDRPPFSANYGQAVQMPYKMTVSTSLIFTQS
tara:strand:+ start:65511 stop:65732 length:222 start_codon:yes stop_codon:yes gene_type:complete